MASLAWGLNFFADTSRKCPRLSSTVGLNRVLADRRRTVRANGEWVNAYIRGFISKFGVFQSAVVAASVAVVVVAVVVVAFVVLIIVVVLVAVVAVVAVVRVVSIVGLVVVVVMVVLRIYQFLSFSKAFSTTRAHTSYFPDLFVDNYSTIN